MNKQHKGDNLPKERCPLSRLFRSPTEACAHDQVDGSDLACVELFESALASSSLKTPAASAMERPLWPGVVDL